MNDLFPLLFFSGNAEWLLEYEVLLTGQVFAVIELALKIEGSYNSFAVFERKVECMKESYKRE